MKLEVKTRERTGKENSKKLRKDGWVPAVVYGVGESNWHIAIPLQNIHELLRETHGDTKVISMKLENQEKDVIIKHIDRDPITGEVMHLDFQIVHKGEEIHADVPVQIVGTAKGIKLGGILEVLHWHIPMKGDVSKIPPHITIDVTNLGLHDSIHVKDLKVEGVKILMHPEDVIVTVIPPRRAEGIEEEIAPEAEGKTPGEESK